MPSDKSSVSTFAKLPVVTVPVNIPLNLVDDNVPVDGLYDKLPSISKSWFPDVDKPPATNASKLFSLVDSLSVT